MANNYSQFEQHPIRHRGKFSVFFGLIAVLVIVLGLNYIYQKIRGTVDYNVPGFITDQANSNEVAQTKEDLKKTDVDQDGLNDYQELYQYHTSMFLPDTDSDGVSDLAEVTKGEDALCPRGQNCNLLQLITPKTKIADVIHDVSLDPNMTFEDAVVAEFRKFLVESGIDKAEVDKLTNSDLLVIMDAIENSGILDQNQLNATTTPQEIRSFLLRQPDADANEINKLSDSDLLKIRDKILEQ